MTSRVFILIFLVGFSNGSKILAFFPMAGPSHHIIFQRLITALANKGHQITFVTPFSLKKLHIGIKEILINNPLEGKGNVDDLIDFGKYPVYKISSYLGNLGLFVCENVYSTKEFQNLIHSGQTFDLILFESLFLQESHSALMHIFNAPGVDILGHGEFSWVNDISGNEDNTAYMIDFKSLYTDEMSFLERLKNKYITLTTKIVNLYYMHYYQKLVDKYFTGLPPLSEMLSNKSLILINSHHSTGYSYPKAPHVKEIGGLHIKSTNELPQVSTHYKNIHILIKTQDVQKFLDDAQHGVIYFSFGTNINMTEILKSKLIFEYFGSLKQRVILKWGSDNLPKVSSNVKLSKWLPQQDILSHKNVKLFITHGGYLSISEAVYHGVPIIGIPFFGDQPKNMVHVSSKGYGILIKQDNFTLNSIKWAINEIFNNPKYKNEIMKRSILFKDRPMKPMDEAIYWIEYVIRHKNVLQPKSIQLPFYKLYLFDIYLLIFGVLCVLKIFMSKFYLLICRKHQS